MSRISVSSMMFVIVITQEERWSLVYSHFTVMGILSNTSSPFGDRNIR